MRMVATRLSRRSLKTDPQTLRRNVGVSWLSLSPAGDGAGHPDDSLLIMRNMLPAKDFSHAAHDTKTPGDEKAAMGEYLPDGQYTSKLAFEGSGLREVTRLYA